MTATPSTQAGPALRLVPTPAWEPPYEDPEPTDAVTRHRRVMRVEQPSLALTFLLRPEVPAVPGPPPLRLVVRPEDDTDPDDEPRSSPTPSGLLPDARGWAGRLALAVVEVLGGTRPLSQLRRWTSDDVYAALRRSSHRGQLPGGAAAASPAPPRLPRTRVRAVRVCEPRDGVAEASVVVSDGRRARAIALRLEGVDGRWQCTELAAL
jgi:hypothetical protein